VLQYHQAYADMLRTQAGFVATLVESYERQLERGNVSRTEAYRLRALDLELREQVLEIEREAAYRQMELRSLLGIPAATWLVVSPVALPEAEHIATLNLAALTASARANRPDMRISTLATEQSHARLSYEKAEAVPNVTLLGGYDRGGNFLLNFIGFGAAFEVPVFNRNQGNIQAARLEARQQELLQRYLEERVDNEVLTAYGQVLAQSGFFRSIAAEYEADLDELMDNVNRNFRLRNISLLEYLDFFEAYRENKETLLQARKDLYLLWEELKLVTGTELD
jgi:outer membrane protein, heavy metal efflux system